MKSLKLILLAAAAIGAVRAQALPSITSTSPLPTGAVNEFYSYLFSCSNCAGYTWAVTAGSLPAGLALSTTGSLSGTPTAAGNSNFTVGLFFRSNLPATTASFAVTMNPALTVTTSTLPTAVIGVPYSQNITATGGLPPYTWTVYFGALPAGLTMNASGNVSGTPTALGTSNFTVLVYDSLDYSAMGAISLTVVVPPPAITSTSLPGGIIGLAYSTQLTCTNCGGYSWSLVSGTLPPGLSLTAGGAITGTPTAVGTSNFTIGLSSPLAAGALTQALSITISPQAATILTTALPAGTVGQTYNAQLTCASCGGYSWSIAAGSLPQGLSVSSGGAITGTPGAAGTSGFTVALSSPLYTIPVTQYFTITIAPTPVSIDQVSIPPGFVGTAYSTTLTASEGTPPYTWSFLSTASDGLTIGASTGVISGKPTALGTFPLTVQVTDSAGATGSRGFSLSVSPTLSILTTSLPNGTLNTVYPTQTLTAGGGQPPYRWSITTGSLPAGLTLDGVFGRISGTPTAGGTSQFTLMVTDNQSATATANLSITVGGLITISPSALPGGTVGTAYSQTLTATGGTSPYSFAVTSGALPAGLTLSGAGAITGKPTAAGTANFTVTATDAQQATGQAALSIVVAPPPTLSVTTTSLPNGTMGTAYSQTLGATGGVPPYIWSLTGSLPVGLSLNSTTGGITGTPTAVATANFTAIVTDSLKTTAQAALSIKINAAPVPLTVTPTTLPNATVGVAYTQKLTAAGGTAPYTFAVTLGSLPAGFSFSAGTISGTAPTAESGNFTVTVTDSAGATLNVPLSLNAVNPANPTVSVTVGGTGNGFSQQLPITVALGAGYPLPITGTLSLTFAPSVTPATGVDDAMIQFASGGRALNFTIPAGSTTPAFAGGVNPMVLTGTTAGTITVTTSLTVNGVSLGNTTKTIVNPSGVPFISSVSFQQTPGGVTVTVVGFSSTRDMVSGLFHFAPASNVTFTQSDITVPLSSPFSTWWTNTTQSNPYGTQFTLTAPFSLNTQSTSVVSVTVTLTNSKGASNAVTLSH
jgi:hypothetical protein